MGMTVVKSEGASDLVSESVGGNNGGGSKGDGSLDGGVHHIHLHVHVHVHVNVHHIQVHTVPLHVFSLVFLAPFALDAVVISRYATVVVVVTSETILTFELEVITLQLSADFIDHWAAKVLTAHVLTIVHFFHIPLIHGLGSGNECEEGSELHNVK